MTIRPVTFGQMTFGSCHVFALNNQVRPMTFGQKGRLAFDNLSSDIWSNGIWFLTCFCLKSHDIWSKEPKIYLVTFGQMTFGS